MRESARRARPSAERLRLSRRRERRRRRDDLRVHGAIFVVALAAAPLRRRSRGRASRCGTGTTTTSARAHRRGARLLRRRDVDGQSVWHPWCHYPVGYSGFSAAFYACSARARTSPPSRTRVVGALLVAVVHRLARDALTPRARADRRRCSSRCTRARPLLARSLMTEPLAALARARRRGSSSRGCASATRPCAAAGARGRGVVARPRDARAPAERCSARRSSRSRSLAPRSRCAGWPRSARPHGARRCDPSPLARRAAVDRAQLPRDGRLRARHHERAAGTSRSARSRARPAASRRCARPTDAPR